MMNFVGAINGDEQTVEKIVAAQAHHKKIDGHAPDLQGAKLESPWPGRALPILSFLSSLCVSAVLLFNTADLTALPVILIPLLALAVLNLPTLVFCAVYRSTRRKYVEQRGVDRMNIQDL